VIIPEDRERIIHRYEGSNIIETEAGSFPRTLLDVLKDTLMHLKTSQGLFCFGDSSFSRMVQSPPRQQKVILYSLS
jgi:hypothetical protein